MSHRSDLKKLLDVVDKALKFHLSRDQMNGALHLAETTRWSPLTSELDAARERLLRMIDEFKTPKAAPPAGKEGK